MEFGISGLASSQDRLSNRFPSLMLKTERIAWHLVEHAGTTMGEHTTSGRQMDWGGRPFEGPIAVSLLPFHIFPRALWPGEPRSTGGLEGKERGEGGSHLPSTRTNPQAARQPMEGTLKPPIGTSLGLLPRGTATTLTPYVCHAIHVSSPIGCPKIRLP